MSTSSLAQSVLQLYSDRDQTHFDIRLKKVSDLRKRHQVPDMCWIVRSKLADTDKRGLPRLPVGAVPVGIIG